MSEYGIVCMWLYVWAVWCGIVHIKWEYNINICMVKWNEKFKYYISHCVPSINFNKLNNIMTCTMSQCILYRIFYSAHILWQWGKFCQAGPKLRRKIWSNQTKITKRNGPRLGLLVRLSFKHEAARIQVSTSPDTTSDRVWRSSSKLYQFGEVSLDMQ